MNFFMNLFNNKENNMINSDELKDIDISILDVSDIAKVKSLYPKIQKQVYELLVKIKKAGLQGGIHQAYRSFDEQALLYAKGRDINGDIIDKTQVVTNSRAGYSYHNYGLAIDWVFKTPGWNWDMPEAEWQRIGELGKSCGFKWGGDWGWDKPHFEINFDQKVDKLLAIYLEHKNIQEVWNYLDNIQEV